MKSLPVSGMPARFVAAALVTLLVGVAGCGGSDSAPAVQQGPQLGEPINLADCRDWKDGTVDERLGTLRSIRNYLGVPVPGTGGRGAVLEEQEAYELFNGWCSEEFARGFKLYKLYARAAAFAGR
jgi:hypothetical protein